MRVAVFTFDEPEDIYEAELINVEETERGSLRIKMSKRDGCDSRWSVYNADQWRIVKLIEGPDAMTLLELKAQEERAAARQKLGRRS